MVVSDEAFRYRLRLQEQQQVIRPAGLRIRARHVEAAERVRADHRARALAVEVQVADEEPLARLLELVAGCSRRPRRSGRTAESFASCERVVEVVGLRDREHRAEDLFLEDAGLGVDVGDDGRLDEVAVALGGLAAGDEPAFLLADLDVVEDRLRRAPSLITGPM